MNTYRTLPQMGSQSFRQPLLQTFYPSSSQTSIANVQPTQPTQPVQPTQTTDTQTHVHEFEGSTKIAEAAAEPHNHRFAGVTSQVIPIGPDHVHALFTNTDFFDHHHQVAAITGQPIDVGNGKHVHFVSFITTLDDGHFHEFQLATLILSPLV